MNFLNKTIFWLLSKQLRYVAAATFCLFIQASWGAEHYIKSAEQFMHDKTSEINLKFSRELNFVQLYPGNLCKRCTITLKVESPKPGEVNEVISKEQIKIPSLSGSMLQDADLHTDKYGAATITMNFSGIVSLEIEQGTNKHNLKVSTTPYERRTDNANTDVVAKPAEGVKLPERVFVINLESSTLPLTLKKLDEFPELKDYKNYVTRIEFNNQRWYRHRLGFAASEIEAADLLVKAKTYFPSAWIDTASPSEVGIARKYYTLYPDRLTAPAPVQAAEKKPAAETKPTVTGTVAVAPQLPRSTSGTTTSVAKSAVAPPPAEPLIINTAKTKQEKPALAIVPPVVTGATDEKTRTLMERARQAIIDGNYDLAIGIYSKILASESLQERKDAREYLGLARERNGQNAHARAEYEQYLQDYPSGADADRVRQRLIGLETAKAAPRQELVKSEVKKEEATWDIANSLSQYYRNSNSKLDTPANPVTTTGASSLTQTTDNSLATDFSSNGRYRGDRYDMRYQINLNNYYSFLQNSTKKQDTRLNYAYYDISDKETNMSYRLGRQTQSSYGILGRFDGLFYSYRFDPKYKFNFIYGNPVDFQVTKSINSAKKVMGVSMDMGTFADHWDGNIFAVQQTYEGIKDRQAIGSEIKYLSQNFTVFSILDYDLNFNTLNTALLFSSLRFKDNTSVNFNMDFRKTPMAVMSSAVSGTSALNLSELLQQYPESTVKQLARDRMANAYNASLSLNTPLSQNLQFSADVSYSYTGSTQASINPAIPGTASLGNTFSYGTTLSGNNIMFTNDIAVMSLRYTDANSGASWFANISDSMNLNTDWRINPKFSINHQNNATDSSSTMIYRPGFRFEYKADKSMRFDVDLGLEIHTTKGGPNDGTKEQDHYIYVGYIYDF